jgi:hypothetical protein
MWRHRDLNPGLFACEADTLPLSYAPKLTMPIYELENNRAFSTLSHIRSQKIIKVFLYLYFVNVFFVFHELDMNHIHFYIDCG